MTDRRIEPLLTASALVATVLAFAAPLRAQNRGPDDVIELRDGTTLRGQVAERRADGGVVVVLPTREVRVLSAGEIAAVRLASQVTPSAAPAPAGASASASPATTTTASPPQAAATPPRDRASPGEPSGDAVDGPAPGADEYDDAIATTRPVRGRVPVAFESTAQPLEIGVPLGSTATQEGRVRVVTEYHSVLCRTPCVLYVRPGAFPLWSGGDAVWPYETTLTVPARGLRVRLYAAGTERSWGTLLGILGGVFSGVGAILLPTGVATQSSGPGVPFIVAGGVLLGVGIPMLIACAVLVATHPIGIADARPLRRDARASGAASSWAVGVVPAGEGVLVGGAARF